MTDRAMTDRTTGRGRPRDPEVARRVLAAALDEYAVTGLAGFTMDGVARRARVGKSTLYLRWASREVLLTDALAAHSRRLVAGVTDTGSLAGDITALTTELLNYFLDPIGWISLRVAVDAAVEAVDTQMFYERMVVTHREAASLLLLRAIERGELDPDAPVRTILEVLFGSALMHVLALPPQEREHARQFPAEHAEPLAAVVLTAVRSPRGVAADQAGGNSVGVSGHAADVAG